MELERPREDDNKPPWAPSDWRLKTATSSWACGSKLNSSRCRRKHVKPAGGLKARQMQLTRADCGGRLASLAQEPRSCSRLFRAAPPA